MNSEKPFGLYLYMKNSTEQIVLKDMLQFLRTVSPAHGSSFSYIEASTSLHPQLSLWENFQLETGASSWKDFHQSLASDHSAMVNLLKEPATKCKDAEVWERFLVSLVKGMISPSKNLLIDMNERNLSPFLIQQFKKYVVQSGQSKTIYLATANSSLWLDCAHSIVERKNYQFEIKNLGQDIRKYWAA